jgi:hypothetical protein
MSRAFDLSKTVLVRRKHNLRTRPYLIWAEEFDPDEHIKADDQTVRAADIADFLYRITEEINHHDLSPIYPDIVSMVTRAAGEEKALAVMKEIFAKGGWIRA